MTSHEATLPAVPSAAFKSAYLIHGDDHGRIGERRARLKALAEAQSKQDPLGAQRLVTELLLGGAPVA